MIGVEEARERVSMTVQVAEFGGAMPTDLRSRVEAAEARHYLPEGGCPR